jgi:hypothetical protein
MGEIASIAVILIRTFVPFAILRWPLGGIILAIVGDVSDVMIFEKFGWGFFGGGDYHKIDKFFDIYYLFFAFLIVRNWKNALARRTAKMLFLWRFIGFAIFEFTGFRPVFFLAPNIFEYFYLFWTVIIKFFPSFILTPLRLIATLLILGLPKVAQEYIMHYKYADQTWNFIRDHFFWWLYTPK